MMKSKGFTLVELLLSTALFSFVLLFVTASFVQINRAYNKGITIKRIHESTRLVMADMSRTISSASSNGLRYDADADEGCIVAGGTRYKWQIGFPPNVSSQNWSLIKDRKPTCGEPAGPGGGAVNMLDPKIIVHQATLTQLGSTNTYRLTIELGSNRDDGADPDTFCNQIQDAYCDRASLSTVLTLRS